MLQSYIPLQSFRVGTLSSAGVFSRFAANAALLEQTSRLGRSAFASMYGQWPENNLENGVMIWWGALRYRTGITTLTVQMNNSNPLFDTRLRLSVNGVSTEHALTAGDQTITRAISGSDGQILELMCQLVNPSQPASQVPWGSGFGRTHQVVDIRATPITLAGWPSVPNWTSAPQLRDDWLDQANNAAVWLVNRMALVDFPLAQTVIFAQGPYEGDPNVVLRGSIARTTNHNRLTIPVGVRVLAPGRTERVTLWINGTLVLTQNLPTAVGEYWYTLVHTLTTPVDQIARWALQFERTAGGGEGLSRWFIGDPVLRQSTPIPAPPPRPVFSIRESMTWATLRTRLQQISDLLSAAQTTITNNSFWAAQRPMRRRFVVDPGWQNEVFEPGYVAQSQRIGARIVASGSGITLDYGGVSFSADPQEPVGLYTFEHSRRETLIDNGTPRTVFQFLDAFDGLVPGSFYAARGVDVRYAAEVLR